MCLQSWQWPPAFPNSWQWFTHSPARQRLQPQTLHSPHHLLPSLPLTLTHLHTHTRPWLEFDSRSAANAKIAIIRKARAPTVIFLLALVSFPAAPLPGRIEMDEYPHHSQDICSILLRVSVTVDGIPDVLGGVFFGPRSEVHRINAPTTWQAAESCTDDFFSPSLPSAACSIPPFLPGFWRQLLSLHCKNIPRRSKASALLCSLLLQGREYVLFVNSDQNTVPCCQAMNGAGDVLTILYCPLGVSASKTRVAKTQ